MASEGGMEGPPLTPPPGQQKHVTEVAGDEPGIEGAQPAEARPHESPSLASELEQHLSEDPNSFSFFQAVRLLERLFPERKPVGRFVDPADEVARFSVRPFISFPASEIHGIELEPDGPTRLEVNFMGLIGPLGVLPYYYTLLAAERARAKDSALKEFLDIFHHRMISLFYRAWEKNRFTASYERDQRDRVTEHLMDVVGLGLPSHRELMAVRDEVMLFYTGLLAPHQRSAVALEQLLEDYFNVPVQVDQFVGGWYPLALETQCNVGEATPSETLGAGAVVGDEIWDQQSRVRIRIGPLTRQKYEQFLPTGSAYEPLRTLTRFFSDDRFEFELQLVLAEDEVPGCVIGEEEEAALPLGWCTWLSTAPLERDADEAILTL